MYFQFLINELLIFHAQYKQNKRKENKNQNNRGQNVKCDGTVNKIIIQMQIVETVPT